MTAAAVYLAMILDRLLGEPNKFHPLVGFGQLAQAAEVVFSKPHALAKTQRLRGLLAWLLLVVPPVTILSLLEYRFDDEHFGLWLFNVIVLYFCIGAKSLEEHILRVKQHLIRDDIASARKNLAHMVSRNTEQLNEREISKAGIESVLENGSDAIFAPLFWFFIAGAPGALCYRLINTLDAMWGYRNERYVDFGRTAARMDDLFNWLPARLTALSYALMGNFQFALHCWRTQGTIWKSPNAGPVMASGAGALNLKLGGSATYHNQLTERPTLGGGKTPDVQDIDRAVELIQRTLILWLVMVAALALGSGII